MHVTPERLAPTVDGSDDLIWLGGPDEGFPVPVGLGEVSVDGGLEVDDGAENASRVASCRLLILASCAGNDPDLDIKL